MMRHQKHEVLRLALSLALLGATNAGAATDAPTARPLRIFAAGSLTGALTAVARQFTLQTGQKFDLVYGPAGIMRERIENGEAADLFASANMVHPQTLADQGLATPPVVMARNQMCARALPEFKLTTENLLDRMLDPKVKILTSTPKSDPGGDYAWMLFAKADKIRPGAQATLEAKALQLVGGKHDAPIPPGQDALQYYTSHKKVDISIGYCSSRKTTPDPAFTTVHMPPSLAITADYGLSVLTREGEAHEAAFRFAFFILSPAAQNIIAEFGFTPVAQVAVY